MPKSARVFILLGGVEGPDGWLDSAGMEGLGQQLGKLPDVHVSIFTWDQWQSAIEPIEDTSGKVVIIGYSGGGSRATYLANALMGKAAIDLMVLYDPSPKWQMQPIGLNVVRAVCYHNTNPMMLVPMLGELGGGVLTGFGVETIDIAEQHLLVQADQRLHAETIAAVKKLLAD